MKQLLFTIVLFTLCFSLSAQTGLFGISFGQSKADVQKLLTSSGFTLEISTQNYLTFSNPEIQDLFGLELLFSERGNVSSWLIYYETKDIENLFQQVSDELTALHGEKPIWDEEYEEWVWRLDNNMVVYLSQEDDMVNVLYDGYDNSVQE